MSYSVHDYAAMIASPERMGVQVEALRRHVKPGSVVLDLGAGTGFLSLVACRLGAARVYAIETNPALDVLSACAERNGFADRIVPLAGDSTELDLPERVDLIIVDVRGILPLFGNSLTTIIDARERFLAPGGVLLPARDHLRAAFVEDSAVYGRHRAPWGSPPLELDLGPLESVLLDSYDRVDLSAGSFVAPPVTWATLDYRSREHVDVEGALSWTASRPATVHGVAVWFEAEIDDGLTMSGPASLLHGTALFALRDPVSLQPGDVVSVKLEARAVGGRYVWRWLTRVERRGGGPVQSFTQSTFTVSAPHPAVLKRLLPEARPRLTAEGSVTRAILVDLDQGLSLIEVARRLHAAFPTVFADDDACLERVRATVARYAV